MTQMPTVAFTLEQEYIDKLDKIVQHAEMTKSQYLRNVIKALIDAEERFRKQEEDKNV